MHLWMSTYDCKFAYAVEYLYCAIPACADMHMHIHRHTRTHTYTRTHTHTHTHTCTHKYTYAHATHTTQHTVCVHAIRNTRIHTTYAHITHLTPNTHEKHTKQYIRTLYTDTQTHVCIVRRCQDGKDPIAQLANRPCSHAQIRPCASWRMLISFDSIDYTIMLYDII